MKKFWLIIFISAVLVFTGLPSIYAQEKKPEAKAEFTLEEIVVTAERRETSAQDTPVAVTAWDADVIDEQNISGQADLQMRMPSTMVLTDTVGMRGVINRSPYLGIDAAVGIFQDGFYNPHALEAFSDLFDVERMESIRGPQSTLYGKSTIAGAINIIEKKPTKEWSGQLKGSIGNYERRIFNAAFGGPLPVDNMYYRIVLTDEWFGGDQETPYIGDDEYVNSKDRYRVGARLLYEPVDDLSIYFRFTQTRSDERPVRNPIGESWLQDQRGDPDDYIATEYIPSLNSDYQAWFDWLTTTTFKGSGFRNPYYGVGSVQPGGSRIVFGENPALSDPYALGIGDAGWRTRSENQVDMTVDYSLGDFTIKYLGMYRDWDYDLGYDLDGSPNPDARKVLMQDYNNEDWSSELQVIYGGEDTRFSALGGLYYSERLETHIWGYHYFGDWYWELDYPYVSGSYTFTPTPDHQVYMLFPELQDTSEAVYAQVNIDLTDTLTLGLGGRYQTDRKQGWGWGYYMLPYPYPGRTGVNQYMVDNQIHGAGYDLTDYGYPGEWGYIEDNGSVRILQNEYGSYLRNYSPYLLRSKANTYIEQKGDWSEFLWHISIDWKPQDSTLVYGKVDRGYRPGGFPVGSFQTEYFKAEFITAYEVGWKQLWMNDRFSTIADYYYYDYTDMQTSYTVGFDIYMNNASSMVNQGFEVEVGGYVIENLLASFSYSWNKTEYGDYFAVDQYRTELGSQNLNGSQAPYAPEHKFTVNLTYTLPTDIGDFTVHGIYFKQTEFYSSAFNTIERLTDGYDRMDADISWNSPGYKWRVTLWSKNLMDDEILMSKTLSSSADHYVTTQSWADPRYIGIDISFKW